MATPETRQIAQDAVAKKANQTFMATHYDPYDPRQTRPDGGGIGAFGKKVEWGDVAMGQRKYKQGTLIEIPELEDVKTPYGMGVFRVNDKKNKRYSTPEAGENFDIAIPSSVANAKELRNRVGRSNMTFKVLDNNTMPVTASPRPLRPNVARPAMPQTTTAPAGVPAPRTTSGMATMPAAPIATSRPVPMPNRMPSLGATPMPTSPPPVHPPVQMPNRMPPLGATPMPTTPPPATATSGAPYRFAGVAGAVKNPKKPVATTAKRGLLSKALKNVAAKKPSKPAI